ncbi:hypothetical protein SAY87_026761 [Trapa incisa]|uniref:C2 NT-type domain-containing protein n=1 Tax=Trapa incisa TaxID=236973 RepID=A0AAN7GY97_9MYRT|nr:hypothetical protein SAY87_026761 [Trapa incisa]
MFKLNSNGREKSWEKIDFNFNQLKAIQVPKGWDKLFVTIISVETGKTIAKSSRASVRNGTCHWNDNIAESIRFPHNDSSKDLGDSFYKFVVSIGSARSSILGEATINITSYLQSRAAYTVSVPLKKCNYGTVLQVNIRRLTSHTKLREDESKETNSSTEDSKSIGIEEDNKSDGRSGSKLLGDGRHSNASKVLGPKSDSEGLGGQETTASPFDSDYSSGSSGKESPERKKLPGPNDASGVRENLNGEEALTDFCKVKDALQSSGSSANAQTLDSENFHLLSMRTSGFSKDLEVAGNTTKTFQLEAKELTHDLDTLRKKLSDQSKKQMGLEIDLSEANADRDRLRKEVESMKYLSKRNMVEELEEDIRFQQEINIGLSLQLRRSQESNIELVSVLQEMEEALEKQKLEIKDLKLEQMKSEDLEGSLIQKLADEKEKDARKVKREYEARLSAQEEEIVSLRANLSELRFQRQREESLQRSNEDSLLKEIEFLKEKLEELERDCNELTEENLDLLFKLKDMSNGSLQGTTQSCELLSCEYSAKSVSSSDHETQVMKGNYESFAVTIRELENKNRELENDLVEHRNESKKLKERLQATVLELESEKVRLEGDLQAMQSCLSDQKNDLNILSSKFDSQAMANRALEWKSSGLERQKHELEVNLIDLQRENRHLLASISGLESELKSIRGEHDGLKEEISLLLRLNDELKEQNLKLKEFCSTLGLNLERLTDSFTAKTMVLEDNLSSIVEAASSEEKKLLLKLDSLNGENKKLEEELVQAEGVFSQLYADQLIEVENLHNEIEELRGKLLDAQIEQEKVLSNTADEISRLSADKAELDLYVQEIQSDNKAKKREFEAVKSESETKVKGLMEALAALGQEKERLLKQLESRKLGEGKLRTMVNQLELTLTASEYEKRKMVGETISLKAQLKKTELEELKEKEKLQADHKEALVELEEMKGEMMASIEKISALEKVVKELEGCKHVNISLEEKIVHLEGELAKEAMQAKTMKVRNEHLQQTVKTLEEELKTGKEEKRRLKCSSSSKNPNMSKAASLSKKDTLKIAKQLSTRRKPLLPQSNQVLRGSKDPQSRSNASSLSDNESCLMGSTEADDTFKVPQNSCLARRSSPEDEIVPKEKLERMESELVELRERYSEMSLKYAEVEAQREELVMKLKATPSAKR